MAQLIPLHRLTLVLLSALLIPWVQATEAQAQRDDRPNILWIVAEDMSPDMGCYGDSYAKTPNLDRFAGEGARFTRAFSVSGVCAPSRSAIITGMYPTTIGSHHMRSAAVPPPYVKCFSQYMRAAGYYCTNNAKTDYNFTGEYISVPLGAWDESSRQAHWKNRPEGKPFFAVFNLGVTHESQIRTPDEVFAERTQALAPEDRHDPAEAVLPPYYPDAPEVRNDWRRYHDLITAMDLQAADLLRELDEAGLSDNTIVFFYGDHGRGLPRAKRWIYDSGLQIPLLIRWPGVIEAGSAREDLVSFIDFAPTLLSIARAPIPAQMQGRVFLGPGTQPEPDYIFGARDRMDETYDIIRAARDRRYKYIRNFQPEKPHSQPIEYMDQMPTLQVWRRLHGEGKLTGPQKLFFQVPKPPEELYDTLNDPHEINNLAGDPDQKERLETMRARLERWMEETGDLALVPEPELLERMRPGGQWATTKTPELSFDQDAQLGRVEVTISCDTPGSTIVFTTLEGENVHWELYTGPITLRKTATLRAMAGRLGYEHSEETQARFEIQPGTARRIE